MNKPAFTNQSGFITMDFLFAFVLIMGFSALLFALTFTLTVVEVAQYATYATARTYYGAHKTEQQQRQLATSKYTELINKNKVFAPLFKNGWFKVPSEPFVGNAKDIIPQYGQNALDTFIGANILFNADILKFEIPFFGSTDPSDKGFRTTIASYLGREVSSTECSAFVRRRWTSILALRPSSGANYETNTTPAGYTAIIDDGC